MQTEFSYFKRGVKFKISTTFTTERRLKDCPYLGTDSHHLSIKYAFYFGKLPDPKA